jgi:hypothetical protein
MALKLRDRIIKMKPGFLGLISSELLQPSTQTAWRRTGTLNVLLSTICLVILLSCFLISITRGGSSIDGNTIIFTGDCTKASALNMGLHLLLNLISSLVFASSNYFMQVLSAPSREEVNKAHQQLRSLDIGISSMKNLRFISRFKLLAWLLFLLSSVPIHMVFNSSIFKTDIQGADWQMTISTEAYTSGASTYYGPGASLAPAGSLGPTFRYTNHGGSTEYCASTNSTKCVRGHGEAISLSEYRNASSTVSKMLNTTAQLSHSWFNISATDCLQEYGSCNPRKRYGDLVAIVKGSAADSLGWTREEVFTNLSSNLSQTWNTIVPGHIENSLWYSTQCTTTRAVKISDGGGPEECSNTCAILFGYQSTRISVWSDQNSIGEYAPQMIDKLTFKRLDEDFPAENLLEQNLGYDANFNDLQLRYCLANPQPSKSCKVGVTNRLFLVTIICICAKIAMGSIVIWKLPSTSLVTPGDAIESLITHPDKTTRGLGTLDILDSQSLEYSPKRPWPLDSPENVELLPTLQPRQFHTNPRKLMHIIPPSSWTMAYIPILVSLCLTAWGLSTAASMASNL